MKKSTSRLQLTNRQLQLENSLLQKKLDLTGKTISNSMNGFVSGLMGSGGLMSPLTSFNPTLQNNQYAPITLMWSNLMYLYKTHGLIQTAVDQPVLDAVRGGLDITSDQMSADDLDEIQNFLEENGILERIVDAFIWARLFGGGALVVNSEADASEPLGDELMDGKIEFYDASRWELTCERRIPKSGMYGYYGKQLDESRVITILGKRAPWLIRAQLSDWGMSELERMIEDFNLFLRTRNVIYELLEEAKVDIYQLKGFTAQLASSTGTNLTTRRIAQMNQIKNFNNALIMDKEDSYEMKQIGFGGLAEMMKENRMGISSALRMPMSKLFGIPSTGLTSGEDDIENYNGMIESEVRQPMKQIIRKVLKLIVKHLFHDELDVKFAFKPLRMLSTLEEEQVKTSQYNRYATLFDRMLMSSREIGEAMQKDGLVPIPLQAEKGLLEDHPVPAGGADLSISHGGTISQPKEPAAATGGEGVTPGVTEQGPAEAAVDAPGEETPDQDPKKTKMNKRTT